MRRSGGNRWPRLRLGPLAALAAGIALAIPAAAQADVPSTFFGMSARQPTDEDFVRMGRAGIGTYRFIIPWRSVQPTKKGDLRWHGTDAAVRRAAENGMAPLPVLFGTPRFIKKSPDKIVPPTGSKQELRLWRKFARAAAERYGRGGEFWLENPGVPKRPVRDWIVWNEQNARPFWQPKPNPRKYAKLVSAADRAVSSADPSARIVLGGIYGYPKDRRSISAQGFLRRLYRVKGIERHFESVNVHPYGSGVGAVRKQVEQARRAVSKAGDRRVKMLIGELGWASAGNRRSPSVVGRKGQAKRIRGALNLLIRNRRRWNVTGAAVYVWRDFSEENSCLWCPRAGMLTVKGKQKPAGRALKRVIQAKSR